VNSPKTGNAALLSSIAWPSHIRPATRRGTTGHNLPPGRHSPALLTRKPLPPGTPKERSRLEVIVHTHGCPTRRLSPRNAIAPAAAL